MVHAHARTRFLVAGALVAGLFAATAASAQFSAISGAVTRSVTGIVNDAITQNARAALPPLTIRSSAGAVGALAVSAKGNFLVTAPSDGTVRIWDLANGIEIRRIRDLSGAARAVGVNANETLAAAAQGDTVTVWNLMSGARRHALRGDGGVVTAMAFGADPNILLTGESDGTIIQWDLATGREHRRFIGHDAEIRAIALSANGETMATADADGAIYVWNFEDGTAGERFGPEDEGLTSLAITADGKWIASGASDGEVVLWDDDGDRIGRFGSHDGPVVTLAFSPDGKILASADSDAEIQLWDVDDRDDIVVLEGHRDSIVGVTFEAQHGRLLSASEDGIVRVWDQASGEALARIISTKSGWAVIGSNGRFDGSLDAVRDIAWTGEDGEVDLDRLSDRFYQTGLLSYILDPKAPKLALATDVREEEEEAKDAPAPRARAVAVPQIRKLPPPSPTVLIASLGDAPKIKMLSPRDGDTVEGESIEVTVQVIDEGSGVDEIRLFHNGRIVNSRGNRAATLTDRSGAKRLIHNFVVLLASGDNYFSAVAFSTTRVESKPAKVKVALRGLPKKPSLNVLAIGINTYKNASLNLNYGVPDAKGILKAFDRGGAAMFETVNLTGVYDEQATKEGILAALRNLRASDPNDVVVVYLAGHGELLEDGEWYFLPYDVVYPEKPEQVRRLGISSSELNAEIAKIGGRKVMLLIDSCKSGGALSKFRGFEERKAMRQLARATGVHIVAATAQDQYAVELNKLGHGLFTYAVLEALAGNADGGRKDGFVSVREMLAYIEDRMPELSMRERSSPQYPVIDSRGMDFPLAVAQIN